MSSSVESDVTVDVVGGIVTLGAMAAIGTGKVAVSLIQGTAAIVSDSIRGRRMRQAAEQSGLRWDQAEESWLTGMNQRDSAHQDRLGTLSGTQQDLIHRTLRARDAEAKKELSRSLSELRQAQSAYVDRRCSEIGEDLRRAESAFDDKLTTLARTVDERFERERRDLEGKLAEQTQNFERAMSEQQDQIHQLQGRVETAQAAAEDWLAAAALEVSFIRDTYRHEFFCPGELGAIDGRLRMARDNHSQGVDEAALSLAQECTLQAGLLHSRLELLTNEWEARRLLAQESLEVGLAALEDHRTFELSAIDVATAGESRAAPGQKVDTDHWTQGQWLELQQKLAGMRFSIADEETTVSMDELHEMEAAGRDAISRSVSLTARAKFAVIASILRTDLQRSFAGKLAESGYQVVDNAWSENDERQSNHIVLKGVNGDEISIVLSPKDQGGILSNTVQVHFRDNQPSEAERQEKLETIRGVLDEIYESPAGSVKWKCVPGSESRENAPEQQFNLQEVRKGKAGSRGPERG